MIASTRRPWALAKENLRLDELDRDLASVLTSLEHGGLDRHQAAYLMRVAMDAAADDLAELEAFAAGDPDLGVQR